MPMIRSALADSGLRLSELDGIALGNGPGSFIGMRIGASVAQGLAYGADVPIALVSSLAAVALDAAGDNESVVAIAQDAHVNEVYLGLFRAGDGRVSALAAERLHGCSHIPELDGAGGCIAAGFGWQRYPALLEANRASISSLSDAHYPHAGALLTLGAAVVEQGRSIAPAELVPAYLRQKVAEIPR
jgi:tRNA threonylcarbamoyladenosine biosynthesis protein TsaB